MERIYVFFYSKQAFNGSLCFLLEAFLRRAFPAALTSQCELLEIQADLTNFWMKLQNAESEKLELHATARKRKHSELT